MPSPLSNYLSNYPAQYQTKIQTMLENGSLETYLKKSYPVTHSVVNNKALYSYVMDLKNEFIRKSEPISKIEYDPKIHVIKNALGTHSYVSRVQGSKLKSKNEIRVSTLFKKVPEEFLLMIVVHELAHIKEKEHNKAFYKLCCHMMPQYHQVEFDVRVYLTLLDYSGDIY